MSNPNLSDLFDPELLAAHVEAGNIGTQRHPTEPLRIYNYTQRCQFTGAWDAVTQACRGLIVDDDDRIVARPFPKFHNLHEHGAEAAAGAVNLVPPLRVFDKLDGSLGIAYRRPSDGELAWATRGSFTSAQAEWATRWWSENHDGCTVLDGFTYLAEIIYPLNRIVVDYGDREGLTLLAVLANGTGTQVYPLLTTDAADWVWPGPVVDVFDSVEDVAELDRNARPDSEGYVVLSGDGLTRVKLKADEYMRLHKIITGASSVTVWERLRNGDPLDVLYEQVPDEFAGWARQQVADITAAFDRVWNQAHAEHDAIAHLLPDRKLYAAQAVQSEHRAILFKLADGKPCDDLVWRQVKPERTLPYFVDAELAERPS